MYEYVYVYLYTCMYTGTYMNTRPLLPSHTHTHTQAKGAAGNRAAQVRTRAGYVYAGPAPRKPHELRLGRGPNAQTEIPLPKV